MDKKYTLPYVVVDRVVAHFMEMMRVDGPLPVIWHQVMCGAVVS